MWLCSYLYLGLSMVQGDAYGCQAENGWTVTVWLGHGIVIWSILVWLWMYFLAAINIDDQLTLSKADYPS